MTNLTGSEKQINWANDIRAKLLPACQKYVNEKTAKATDAQKAKPLAFVAWLENQTEAKFWIDQQVDFDRDYSTGMDFVAKFNWLVKKWVDDGCK